MVQAWFEWHGSFSVFLGFFTISFICLHVHVLQFNLLTYDVLRSKGLREIYLEDDGEEKWREGEGLVAPPWWPVNGEDDDDG